MATIYQVIRLDENGNEHVLGQFDDPNVRDDYYNSATASYTHLNIQKKDVEAP